MVKKTLLSLAIAATAAGLAGCNVSSTDKYENDIDNTPVTSGQPGSAVSRVAPVFSPGGGQVPLAIDLVFAINTQLEAGKPGKDGTADTADTTPPVTTALNKLDGFSTVAPIYIEFNSALDPDSVVAGKTVLLAKMNTGSVDGKPDPLATNTSNPFSSSPIVPGDDYEARYITMNDGRTPAIQVLLKKPLDPKTKYMVIVTDGIESASGLPVGPSAEFELVAGNGELPSSALNPVRTAVKGWQQLAAGFLASPLSPASEGSSILSYTFTTGGGADVLKAMAAPGTFLTSQMPTYVHAEGAIKGSVEKQVRANPALEGADEATIIGAIDAQLASNLALVAQGVGQKLNAANAGNTEWTDLPLADGTALRTTLIESDALRPFYYAGLITAIADGQSAGLDSIVDKPQTRPFAAFVSAPNTPVAVSYDAFLTAQVTPKVKAEIEAQVRSNPALEGADEATIQAQIDAALDANLDSTVAAQVTALSSKGTIYQGGLQIPNYLPEAEAGKADNELGNWVASDDAAKALNLPAAPRDKNESTNVTYRFPFAKKLGDNVIPVFATLPADSCDPDGSGPAPAITKPADGWPVAIYQHGITVDRTAGVLVGNALAKACVAMVAIDHAMHGVGPTSATGLVFNVNTIAAGAVDANGPTADAVKSPFAVARLGAVAAGSDFFANLKERHNNVGKNAAQENVAMAFAAAGAAANVGASGDLYINLQDFARTRDGMRQTVLDLMNLAASIGDMDINADGTKDDLNPDNVYFIGHSLGGIIGTTFVAVNNDPLVQTYNPNLPEIKAAVLGNAGGGVVKLLENSPGIGALKILPGLKKANSTLVQGSANLEKFFGVFQATVDSADPINFAGAAHMQTLPILSYTALNDAVVPNNALGEVEYSVGVVNGALTVTGATPGAAKTAKSYLSGTDPLVKALGIPDENVLNSATDLAPVAAGVNAFLENRVSVRTAADKSDHSTFSSANPQATFAEIFGQIGSFLSPASPLQLNGINVQDTSVLEQAN